MKTSPSDLSSRTINKLKTVIVQIEDQSGIGENNRRLEYLTALALRHSIYGVSPATPVREILHMVGDKWTTLILDVLGAGKCRYSALRELVSVLSYEQSISHRVLTSKLRLMERDGLVTRRAWSTVPPRVEYELTELGHSLTRMVEGLFSWAESNFETIENARAAFDSAPKQNFQEDI